MVLHLTEAASGVFNSDKPGCKGGMTVELERNQSKYALANGVRGGFFLGKKPLGIVPSGYSYSGFAVAQIMMGIGKLDVSEKS